MGYIAEDLVYLLSNFAFVSFVTPGIWYREMIGIV